MKEVEHIAHHILPATVSTSFQGEVQAFESSLAGLRILLTFAVLVIYIVLGFSTKASSIRSRFCRDCVPQDLVRCSRRLFFGYELNLCGFVGIMLVRHREKKRHPDD